MRSEEKRKERRREKKERKKRRKEKKEEERRKKEGIASQTSAAFETSCGCDGLADGWLGWLEPSPFPLGV